MDAANRFALLSLEPLLGAPSRPIARQRHMCPVEPSNVEQHPTKRFHRLAFAVHKGIDLTVEPWQGEHRRSERLGCVLRIDDPPHLNAGWRVDLDDGLGIRRFDDRHADGRCGQRLERRRDRRHRRQVTNEQVPGGVRVGCVATTRPEKPQSVARLGCGSPRPGDALIAMHDEVDLKPTRSLVDSTDGVGARDRSQRVARDRELQLDVFVGLWAILERTEAVAAEPNSNELIAEPVGVQHLEFDGRARDSRGRA